MLNRQAVQPLKDMQPDANTKAKKAGQTLLISQKTAMTHLWDIFMKMCACKIRTQSLHAVSFCYIQMRWSPTQRREEEDD